MAEMTDIRDTVRARRERHRRKDRGSRREGGVRREREQPLQILRLERRTEFASQSPGVLRSALEGDLGGDRTVDRLANLGWELADELVGEDEADAVSPRLRQGIGELTRPVTLS